MGFDGLPYLARSTFRHEQRALIAASLGLAIAMDGFPQLFLKKGFSGSDWLLPVLVACKPAASLVAALGTHLLRRWRQSSVAAGCMFVGAAATAAVPCLPLREAWAPLFTGLTIIATTAVMVSVQARAAIWHANYPAGTRGGIVSRNFILQTILMAAFAQSVGAALDLSRESYRLIYVVGAVSFFIAGRQFRQIRVRRESLRLRRDARNRQRVHPLAVLGVLRRDRRFAWYMTLQMILGGANLMVLPLVPKILTDVFGVSYSSGNLALVAAPQIAQLLTIPALGGLFDRTSIFRFRALGAVVAASSRGVLGGAVVFVTMPLLILSQFILGASQSFGRLAWSMGHMAFGGEDDTHLYMGAHLLLTGLRGMTMPFVGIFLYNSGLGMDLIWMVCALQSVAALGYWATTRYDKRKAAETPAPSRAAP